MSKHHFIWLHGFHNEYGLKNVFNIFENYCGPDKVQWLYIAIIKIVLYEQYGAERNMQVALSCLLLWCYDSKKKTQFCHKLTSVMLVIESFNVGYTLSVLYAATLEDLFPFVNFRYE